MKITIVSAFLALLVSITLIAQTPDVSKPVLSKADVENFITNYKPLDAELKKLDSEYDAEDDFQTFISGLEESSEVNQVVKKYGFLEDLNDFVSKVMAISFAYFTIKMETEGSPELDKALQNIDNDKSLTAEQKEESKEQLKQIMGAVGSAFTSMVNPQDVETVRPYVSKLGLVFEE